MKTTTLLLLFLCVSGTASQGNLDYDDYGSDAKTSPKTNATEETGPDARGHRPLVHGHDHYNPNRYTPPPLGGGGRYRGRPAAASKEHEVPEEKKVHPESGGCSYGAAELGVLCPTGCELKTALLKQERSVASSIKELTPLVLELSRSSNVVYNFATEMSSSLTERQRLIGDNGRVVGQFTAQVEDQHAFIKETVDTVFPSTVRVLQGIVDKVRLKIEKLEKALQTQREECKEPCQTKCPIPVVTGKECEDIYRRGGKDSQMYLIQPDPLQPPYKVFCDQSSRNGGWLLIQNRLDGSVDFGRRWDEYRRGFGNIALDTGKGHCETPGEYWLGNERISHLTNMGPTELLIEMQDWTGAKVHAQYGHFTTKSESSNYVLTVSDYSGNAGNCLLDGALELFGENRTMTKHHGAMFSTYDRDNDNWSPGDPSKQCSREDGGGWWYNRCHSANPNGRYYLGGAYTKQMAKHGTDDGVVWMNWKGSWYSLKAISMKIRPVFTP
ncbi:fibrinogen beta chain [Syngnathoides biaculeatus]|uniref:fibrinogen beta chain n=1 Tax=Syngnathoides biaculeatus TaxID=300417 RepID=UPI002ADD5A9F|nr:fibrinogen beta chain [Syngnathoides biaculeatus]